MNRKICNMLALYKRVVMVLAVMACPALASAADYGKYTGLIREVSQLPSKEIIRRGDASLAAGKGDEAMVLYMVVCGRDGDNTGDSDRAACVEAHLKAGDIYYGRGDFARALDFYVNGLRLHGDGGGGRSASMFYKNIGNVYAQFNDYGQAMKFYTAGLKECGKHPDADTERKILINLTGLSISAGKPGDARKYFEASLKVKGGGDKVTRFMIEFNRSLVMSAYGRYSEAVPLFRRLARHAVTAGLPPLYECCAYQELYKTFDKMGLADSAFLYLRKCEQAAVKHNLRHQFVDMLKDASAIYEDAGLKGKAMEYKAKYLTVSDSILNLREFERVKNLQFQYEMDKAGKDINDLRRMHESNRQTIERQRSAILIGLATLLTVSFLVVLLYRQNRKLKDSYVGLYALNCDIISRQERMDRRHADDLGRISLLEAEAAGLRARAEVPSVDGDIHEEKKYQTSGLDCTRQQTLAEAIASVMDNGEEFCRDDFSLDRLAALVGSNSKYVSQTINSTYNKNFSNFVNEYRIRTACKRLSDEAGWGNFTVKAVGESVGYKSHATFVNIFKKITGLTPSLYQKLAKNNS